MQQPMRKSHNAAMLCGKFQRNDCDWTKYEPEENGGKSIRDTTWRRPHKGQGFDFFPARELFV